MPPKKRYSKKVPKNPPASFIINKQTQQAAEKTVSVTDKTSCGNQSTGNNVATHKIQTARQEAFKSLKEIEIIVDEIIGLVTSNPDQINSEISTKEEAFNKQLIEKTIFFNTKCLSMLTKLFENKNEVDVTDLEVILIDPVMRFMEYVSAETEAKRGELKTLSEQIKQGVASTRALMAPNCVEEEKIVGKKSETEFETVNDQLEGKETFTNSAPVEGLKIPGPGQISSTVVVNSSDNIIVDHSDIVPLDQSDILPVDQSEQNSNFEVEDFNYQSTDSLQQS